jgi:hypothetical protein
MSDLPLLQDRFPGRSCSLCEAAGAAQEAAAAELLKTVPVYGLCNAKNGRVPAAAELDGETGGA